MLHTTCGNLNLPITLFIALFLAPPLQAQTSWDLQSQTRHSSHSEADTLGLLGADYALQLSLGVDGRAFFENSRCEQFEKGASNLFGGIIMRYSIGEIVGTRRVHDAANQDLERRADQGYTKTGLAFFGWRDSRDQNSIYALLGLDEVRPLARQNMATGLSPEESMRGTGIRASRALNSDTSVVAGIGTEFNAKLSEESFHCRYEVLAYGDSDWYPSGSEDLDASRVRELGSEALNHLNDTNRSMDTILHRLEIGPNDGDISPANGAAIAIGRSNDEWIGGVNFRYVSPEQDRFFSHWMFSLAQSYRGGEETENDSVYVDVQAAPTFDCNIVEVTPYLNVGYDSWLTRERDLPTLGQETVAGNLRLTAGLGVRSKPKPFLFCDMVLGGAFDKTWNQDEDVPDEAALRVTLNLGAGKTR